MFGSKVPRVEACRSRGDPGGVAQVPCDIPIVELSYRPIPRERPAVLVLGPMHGDDRVSAIAAVDLVEVFVERAGIDPWISRLLRTRRIVVVPIPNPSGYDRFMHYEETSRGTLVDPALDFPFMRNGSSQGVCLQSATAQVIDLLFQEYVFVVALALQDKKQGSESISFSWASDHDSMCRRDLTNADSRDAPDGDLKECASGWESPDHAALYDVADRMAAFAGPAHLDDKLLQVGPLNQLGTPSQGGWLDYAYASSYREDLIAGCGGFRPTNTSHRAAAFVIDASREAEPNRKHLGKREDLYRHSSVGNIVTRVLRAALVGIDMAFPYVFFMSPGGTAGMEARRGILHMRWSIGGAVHVDETYLTCRIEDGEEWTTTVKSGQSMWAQSFEDVRGLSFYRLGQLATASYDFRETVLLYNRLSPKQRSRGTTLYVRADAVVDGPWRAGMSENSTGPQSHLVQLRTNHSWAISTKLHSLSGVTKISTPTLMVEVPPVTGFMAFVSYAYEFVLFGLFMCVGPPFLFVLARRGMSTRPLAASARASWMVQQRVKRSLRGVSHPGAAAEFARAKARASGSNTVARGASSSVLFQPQPRDWSVVGGDAAESRSRTAT